MPLDKETVIEKIFFPIQCDVERILDAWQDAPSNIKWKYEEILNQLIFYAKPCKIEQFIEYLEDEKNKIKFNDLKISYATDLISNHISSPDILSYLHVNPSEYSFVTYLAQYGLLRAILLKLTNDNTYSALKEKLDIKNIKELHTALKEQYELLKIKNNKLDWKLGMLFLAITLILFYLSYVTLKLAAQATTELFNVMLAFIFFMTALTICYETGIRMGDSDLHLKINLDTSPDELPLWVLSEIYLNDAESNNHNYEFKAPELS